MDYIKREDALTDAMCVGISCQECPFRSYTVSGGCMMANYIMSIPAADVEERKRGTWKQTSDCGGVGYPVYTCSKCGMDNDYETNFCPNCGAKMEG